MSNRRDVLAATVGFCTYAFLREARALVPKSRNLPAAVWVQRQEDLARGLAAGTVTPDQWHTAVNDLAHEVELASLTYELRRAGVRAAGAALPHDPVKRFVTFKAEDGKPLRRRYAAALFSFNAESVITPHGHRHMASAHLVVEGRLRVRTFDRVGEEASALLLRPALDVLAEPGHATAMTSSRDNVHWFAPRSARAMTLDVIVDGLGQGRRYEIQPVDPLGGRERPDGTVRAELLSFERSSELYPPSR